MYYKLSRKQIGKRIAQLRINKGWSQEDLAKSIKISRPSLTQIELGNRGLDIQELQKIAQILNFSIDSFLSKEYNGNIIRQVQETAVYLKSEQRISSPAPNEKKREQTLLYLLKQCAGNANITESAFHLLMYFCDFNYYELQEEHLSGTNYLKLNNRPVAEHLDLTLARMQQDKLLKKVKVVERNKSFFRLLPLQNPQLKNFNASEIDCINQVITQMCDWPYDYLSEYAANDLPLKVTSTGDVINYELALYREAPYSFKNYQTELD